MEPILSVFSAFGLSASAGLNAYIPLLVVAVLARYSNLIRLNPPWETLSNGWVIVLLVFLALLEFAADKVPAVNHVNDALQTFVRPAAGAIVFAASVDAIGEVHPVLAMALGLLVAGGVHAVKAAAVRPAVTATTGGTGNVPVSILEDLISAGLSILAAVIPVFIAALTVLLTAWAVYWLWRRARATRPG